MLDYKQHQRASTSQAPSMSQRTSAPTRASSMSELASTNIAHGYSRLQSLDVNIRRSSSLTNIQRPATPANNTTQTLPQPSICHQETEEERAIRKARELQEDKIHVESELTRYEAAGPVTSFENTGMVNIDEFWSVSLFYMSFLSKYILTSLVGTSVRIPFLISSGYGCTPCSGIICAM